MSDAFWGQGHPVYVFDLSQTEGSELPQFAKRTTGEIGEYRERLIDWTWNLVEFLQARKWQIE